MIEVSTTRENPRLASRTALAFAAIAGSVLLLLLLRIPSLFEPAWYRDEGIFAAIAYNLREGQTLYADAWDNKPPLIFYTYAGVQALFGEGVFPLHLVATVSVVATQVVTVVLAARLYGPLRAAAAGLVFAVVMGTPVIEGNLAMTETFMILPSSLGVLAFVIANASHERRRMPYYAAAGVLFGIAAAYKQVALFDAAAVAAMILMTHQKPWTAIGVLAAGIAAVQVLIGAFFLASGAFGDYVYAIAGSLPLYAEISPEQDPFARLASVLPAFLAVAWLLRRRQLGLEVGLAQFPVLWLTFAFAGATSSSFPFPHYLQQVAAPLALSAAAAPALIDRDRTNRLALATAALLMVAVTYAQFGEGFEHEQTQLRPYYRAFVEHQRGDITDEERDYRFDGGVVAVRDIGALIGEDGAGSTAFAWSELPWLFASAELTNPTRYYTSFLGEVIPDARAEIIRDLEASPPAYVVVSDDTYAPFPELEAYVAERYTLLRQVNDWRLYRRNDLTGRLEVQE